MATPPYNPNGGLSLIKIGLLKHYIGKKGKRFYQNFPATPGTTATISTATSYPFNPSASASPSPSEAPEPEPEFESGIYICKKDLVLLKDAGTNQVDIDRSCCKGSPYEIEKILTKWEIKYKIKRIIVGDEPNEVIRVVNGFIIEEHFRLFC